MEIQIRKIPLEDGFCIVRVDGDDDVIATQCFPNEWTAQNAMQLLETVLNSINIYTESVG